MADTKLFSSQMSNPLPGNARLTLKKSDGTEIGSYEPLGEDEEITLPTGGSDNVFFATYGTTTLREVLDAIAADKLVIARDLNNNQYTIAEATEVRVVFESLHRAPASTSDVTYERLVLVDSPVIGGGWRSESQALAKKSDLIVDAPSDNRTYARKNRTWVEVDGGISGPSTVFKTVADMQAASLNVGDVVETAGFYSVDDGGGAKYQIQSTGTANGMDLINLNNGKIAKLLIKGEGYPEQFGYKLTAPTVSGGMYDFSNVPDLTPYIQRMFAVFCRNIKLHVTPGDFVKYVIKTTCELSHGVSISGAYKGYGGGAATNLWFVPSSNSTKIMFNTTGRNVGLYNLVMKNNPTSSSGYNDTICINFDYVSSDKQATKDREFHEINIQGFKYGIYMPSVLGDNFFGWHMTFSHVSMANNYINAFLSGGIYCVDFNNCYFGAADKYNVHVHGHPFTVKWDSCNFGTTYINDTIIKVEYEDIPNAHVDVRDLNLMFVNSQFELEKEVGDQTLPTGNRHIFFDIDDENYLQLTLDNCVFIITPLARESNYTNRIISLGNKTQVKLLSCIGPGVDVDYPGNYFLENDFQKVIFDENRPPKNEIGSVELDQCFQLNYAYWDEEHLPCVKRSQSNMIEIGNTTDFIRKFPTAKDGVLMFNLDNGRTYQKVGDLLLPIGDAPSNVVRIGNEIYNFVVINGRKWITRNLNLYTPDSRNYSFYNHPDWGQYYYYTDIAVVQSMLPEGWRVPNETDLRSLVGDATKARSLQGLGWSGFPNATNTTGFSATPSERWVRPSSAPTRWSYNRGVFWGQASSSSVQAIMINESSASYAGWSLSDAQRGIDGGPILCPIRVCADA